MMCRWLYKVSKLPLSETAYGCLSKDQLYSPNVLEEYQQALGVRTSCLRPPCQRNWTVHPQSPNPVPRLSNLLQLKRAQQSWPSNARPPNFLAQRRKREPSTWHLNKTVTSMTQTLKSLIHGPPRNLHLRDATVMQVSSRSLMRITLMMSLVSNKATTVIGLLTRS